MKKKWTQRLYGKKYKFQNPLHQNYRHTKAIADYLNVDHDNVHSVVFFIGDNTEFKTDLPRNVMNHGLSSYIKSFQNNVFSSSEISQFEQKISQLNDQNISKSEHLTSIKKRLSNETICPKCGSELKKRQAKQGRSAGTLFLGCSNFPKCRYTKRI